MEYLIYSTLFALCVIVEMTVGKDQEVTVKSKGAGGQGKVAAKVTGPSGKPVASKVWHMIRTHFASLQVSMWRRCVVLSKILHL